ncbi:GNAT family N-acetyltransferase [Streptomyces sp. NPDC006285]|uniref:GNAT family N-acetyltransferase n=1 Tax=Streptomyces sp. NPDC006285 TaxID=3364742 RepID=UPI0036B97631
MDHTELLGSGDVTGTRREVVTVTVEARGREGHDGRAVARRTAAVARAAFATGDPYPGLPVADGATETAEDVRADLARSARLWTAFDADGEPLGCVRALPAADGAWAVRRLAVAPRGRGRAVGRRLIRALEDDARAEGLDRVVLDAVVERGNPAFYSRLGYRTAAHFPGPDKPLSEVHMVRELSAPDEDLPHPWGGEPVPLWEGAVRVWFSGPGGTAALPAELGPDPAAELAVLAGRAARHVGGPARFRGADGLPRRPRGVLVDARLAEQVPAFLLPRAVDPGALALWRTRG